MIDPTQSERLYTLRKGAILFTIPVVLGGAATIGGYAYSTLKNDVNNKGREGEKTPEGKEEIYNNVSYFSDINFSSMDDNTKKIIFGLLVAGVGLMAYKGRKMKK